MAKQPPFLYRHCHHNFYLPSEAEQWHKNLAHVFAPHNVVFERPALQNMEIYAQRCKTHTAD